MLVGPDVFLSTAECTDAFESSIASGFIEDAWVTLDANPLDEGEIEPALDCTTFVHVTAFDINPLYFSSFGAQSDVGVVILEASQSITPASLPPRNRLKSHPRKNLPDITTVSSGLLADAGSPTGFDTFTLARRFSHAAFGAIGSDTQVASLIIAPPRGGWLALPLPHKKVWTFPVGCSPPRAWAREARRSRRPSRSQRSFRW